MSKPYHVPFFFGQKSTGNAVGSAGMKCLLREEAPHIWSLLYLLTMPAAWWTLLCCFLLSVFYIFSLWAPNRECLPSYLLNNGNSLESQLQLESDMEQGGCWSKEDVVHDTGRRRWPKPVSSRSTVCGCTSFSSICLVVKAMSPDQSTE